MDNVGWVILGVYCLFFGLLALAIAVLENSLLKFCIASLMVGGSFACWLKVVARETEEVELKVV